MLCDCLSMSRHGLLAHLSLMTLQSCAYVYRIDIHAATRHDAGQTEGGIRVHWTPKDDSTVRDAASALTRLQCKIFRHDLVVVHSRIDAATEAYKDRAEAGGQGGTAAKAAEWHDMRMQTHTRSPRHDALCSTKPSRKLKPKRKLNKRLQVDNNRNLSSNRCELGLNHCVYT